MPLVCGPHLKDYRRIALYGLDGFAMHRPIQPYPSVMNWQLSYIGAPVTYRRCETQVEAITMIRLATEQQYKTPEALRAAALTIWARYFNRIIFP